MKKLGVSKGVPEGGSSGAWGVGGVTRLARARVARPKPLGVWGLGAELSTRSRGPESDRRSRFPTPRTRHYARTPCGQVFAAAAAAPPPRLHHYITGGWVWSRLAKTRGLRRPPPPLPTPPRGALVPSRLLCNPSLEVDRRRRAALLTRAGQCG